MISVFIPAFNEEKRIAPTVETILSVAKEMQDLPIEIIIVNDGSTDGTAEEILKLEKKYPVVRSIHHQTNKGMGAGFQEAIRTAKYDKITLFAGDNDVGRFTIGNVFKNLNAADVVVAYPLNTEVRSAFRYSLSTIFNLIYCVTFGVHMKYLNGTPCLPVARLRELDISAGGYSILTEINVKLLRSGATYFEIESYFNPQAQKSSAVSLKSLFRVVFAYFRLVYEVYFRNRARYGSKPKRIIPL